MTDKKSLLFLQNAIWLVSIFAFTMAQIPPFKFTNVKCEDHNVEFSHFEECKLRVIGRGIVALNIRVDLYKTPITNISVNLAFYKKANGYKPFLYNTTVDMCQFFRTKKRFPIIDVAFGIFVHATNINHTCPYSGSVIVKDLLFEQDKFRYLPIPGGQYLVKMNVFAYNDLKATVQIFFTYNEQSVPKSGKLKATQDNF